MPLLNALRRCAVMAALVAAASAHAQSPAAPEVTPAFVEATQRWLDEAVAQALPAGNLRMEVTVGTLDTRLRLAPCGKVEPYLPTGTRLWGKTRLGLRCIDGVSRWNVFLPLTVKAIGPAWVLRGNVAAGAVLGPNDAVQEEIDWAAEPSPVVAEMADWVGAMAARPLTAGQTLRQAMVRPAQVFQAGSQVRVVAQGGGFTVASDGQALTAGVVGQPARVRMESGRILAGEVIDARTVRVQL